MEWVIPIAKIKLKKIRENFPSLNLVDFGERPTSPSSEGFGESAELSPGILNGHGYGSNSNCQFPLEFFKVDLLNDFLIPFDFNIACVVVLGNVKLLQLAMSRQIVGSRDLSFRIIYHSRMNA